MKKSIESYQVTALPNFIKTNNFDVNQNFKIPISPKLMKIFHPHGLDDYGQIFQYGDNIYRGISPEHADVVSSYFTSGLIEELEDKKLIPNVVISPYEFPEYAFILQHEKLNNDSYAWEWSFTMFKDAALMCVDVMETLWKYGFSSKDGHAYNIMFKNNQPIWVDLTSFVKRDFVNAWPIKQFFHRIYQPLEIMALQPPVARKFLYEIKLPWGVGVYRNLVCKFGLKLKKHLPPAIHRYEALFERQATQKDPEKIRRGFESYRQKIKSFHMDYKTYWTNYHHDWLDNNKQINLSDSTKRFLTIFSIIKSLPIKSVVEFAANQGMFSAMMAEINNIEKIVAVDYDENAVDTMYKLLSEHRLSDNCVKKIFPMLVDFMQISDDPVEQRSLSERIKSDAVVALAMTHHLLLSQRINIEKMFERFSRFTNRFIFVEFMPLGLYSSDNEKQPEVPNYYTEKWFVDNMEKYFDILFRLPLEKNRILFVGELK